MRILKFILFFFTIILIGILLFISFNLRFTGAAVKKHYSFTKAICDENNYCQDYEIVCENGELISISPTGRAVQFSENWQDPRDKETINSLCN